MTVSTEWCKWSMELNLWPLMWCLTCVNSQKSDRVRSGLYPGWGRTWVPVILKKFCTS